jgi:glycosyltransferase involved in cell wall biosynthesis
MRLLLIGPDMKTGGAQRNWITLAQALKARGHESYVLCLVEEGALFGELAAAGIPAGCVHMRGRLDIRALRSALAMGREWQPDLVVSYGVAPQLIGARIARRAGAPHVLTEHTPVTVHGELPFSGRLQRALARRAARGVDLAIAVSASQAPPLERLGHRRIEVVPNGVFENEVRPAAGREATRAALGARDEHFVVVCLAGLRREKRVDLFCAAIGAARREQPHVRGFAAGDGPERAALEPLAAAAGVELLGDRRDAPDLLAAADAFCLPGEIEALPVSILEAMALARPVVAARVGGVAEAVADGETGFVVPPGDRDATARALATLAADPNRAAAMGKRGRERQLERFSGEQMVEAYAQTFETIVAGGR